MLVAGVGSVAGVGLVMLGAGRTGEGLVLVAWAVGAMMGLEGVGWVLLLTRGGAADVAVVLTALELIAAQTDSQAMSVLCLHQPWYCAAQLCGCRARASAVMTKHRVTVAAVLCTAHQDPGSYAVEVTAF